MRIVSALIMSALLLGVAVSPVHAADTSLDAQITAASTPEQHKALAEQYEAMAADSREKAALHSRMAERYKQGKSVLDQSGHCSSIASREEQNAADYEAMAKAHAAAATK